MKVLCNHCQLPCKRIGLVECSKYNAKANKPQQLQEQIKKAYSEGRYDKARELQSELDKFWYGDKKV